MADAIVMLQNARLQWPALFTPKAGTDDAGQPTPAKFQATLLIDPDSPSVKSLLAAANAVAVEKWKDKAQNVLAMLKDEKRLCFSSKPKVTKDGDAREEFVGKVWISASNKIKPAVVDANPSVVLTEADGKVYAGCYVNAKISLWAMDHPKFGRRVCANIIAVQYAGKGDAFSSASVNSAEGFENLAVGDESSGFDTVSI